MKIFRCLILITLGTLCLTPFIQGKIVPFKEDPYTQQADKELMDITEKAEAIAEFNTDYQVVIPTKAGIEINPWNKFMTYGINPFTKNPFILINPEWFQKIPEDQQLFLLVRNFIILGQSSPTPLLTNLVSYIFIFLSIMLFALIFWLLGKSRFKTYKFWVRLLIALGAVILLELIILDRLELKLKTYFNKRFDKNMITLAIEKTKDREAAIKALEYFDNSIKNEIKNGETLFASAENLFEEYAQSLKF